ncbi:MAG: decarboxylating 6-phosphogluconate dehydrogenase [Comamonadaceae bacterium]|nr:MAG: decarboxylating 6-phosphogluconate dehydrogenase [Comamonadaceae bacterium]
MVGLGRMGANMARRLARGGFSVHGFDPSAASRDALAQEPGIVLHTALPDAVGAVAQPRIVWLMLPAGDITTQTLKELEGLLKPGDILVDGGNANYLDSQVRAAGWKTRGVHFVDCGVSGGVWGLDGGYCLMFGGEASAAEVLAPVFECLAPAHDRGWLHCGPPGSGHFTKMIHNGIEYGMMQAYAEGFALMAGNEAMNIDLGKVAELWRHGSVVRSWLLDLTTTALEDPDALAFIAPVVADSGEGRWTIDESIRQGTPAPVIGAALMARFSSQGKADTSNKLLSLMRKGFGGHATVGKG